MAKLSKKIGKRCSKSQMARFMARNSKWPENIFYGQRGANMARLEKSGHQMANLAALPPRYINRISPRNQNMAQL